MKKKDVNWKAHYWDDDIHDQSAAQFHHISEKHNREASKHTEKCKQSAALLRKGKIALVTIEKKSQ